MARGERGNSASNPAHSDCLEALWVRSVLSAAAGGAVGAADIAEGYTFGHSPTFTRHLGVAYGSAVETGELVRLLGDAEIIAPSALTELRERNARCQRLILGLLKRRRALRS